MRTREISTILLHIVIACLTIIVLIDYHHQYEQNHKNCTFSIITNQFTIKAVSIYYFLSLLCLGLSCYTYLKPTQNKINISPLLNAYLFTKRAPPYKNQTFNYQSQNFSYLWLMPVALCLRPSYVCNRQGTNRFWLMKLSFREVSYDFKTYKYQDFNQVEDIGIAVRLNVGSLLYRTVCFTWKY